MERARAVATIGVFDGVHRGHRLLLDRVVARAAGEGVLSLAVTFDPPPDAVLSPQDEPFQITLHGEKEAILRSLGIQRLLVLPFSKRMAAMSPREFVLGVLLRDLDLVGLVIGYDFRFGRGSAGDVQLLEAVGAERGFWIDEVPAVRFGEAPISSTRIRDALARGAVSEAAGMLGRPFAVTGRVVGGRALGRRVLVPTANVEVESGQMLPARGVYLVEVSIGEGIRAGVAKVGPSPTVGGEREGERVVEVHLLDFAGDLRGSRLTVRFLEWIRAERRFADLAALRAAIDEDIRWATAYLRRGLR
jgi:riboflavin kinase/FMN adenylyltransferase